MRQSQPEHMVLDDTGGPPDHQSPVRRFPRVGAQFQTRISKSAGPSIRPTPDRMSLNFPFLSQKEAGERNYFDVNASLSAVGSDAAVNQGGSNLKLRESKTNRGGTLVYSPGRATGDFLNFVQPFITSTCDQLRPQITNEAWIQHMIHLHSTESTRKRSRASRGGVKRKRAENEALVWNLEKNLERLKRSTGRNIDCEILGEEQAVALEHLGLCYDGNVDAAEFNTLIELSGGQALKMRKREEKERTKRRSKTPSQQTSECWRDMYELCTLPYVQTMLGQLQDDTYPSYTVRTNTSRILNNAWGGHNDVSLVLEPDDLKGAWRSILACGKSIERQLSSESPGGKKPLLCTLLTFVSQAYALPTPESCFGTHHVMIEEVSNTMISILNHMKESQNVHAKIRDKVFDECQTGIDSDDLLKFLDTEYSSLPIRLREVDNLYKFREIIIQWETRLVRMLSVDEEELETMETKNYLKIAEDMQEEARGHGYRSKALVQLDTRLNKAYDLMHRISTWKDAGRHGKMSTIKTISAFVKEAKRIKLYSPEVMEIFEFHRIAEEWIDRANIAVRSKISLDEIKNLICRGEEMTVDLSEHIDKLKTRVRIAEEWLEALNEFVPCSNTKKANASEVWEKLQFSLQDGSLSRLHELSSEGNRIPVDIISVKLLQLALDARNWTVKAQKWIPNNADSKRGKLCDLREHLEKVSSLRSKLPFSDVERKQWSPHGENELTSIIIAADSWLEKYKLFLSGDNRRSDIRSCLSIDKLRTIVEEGNSIYANMGNSISKISRILVQAETWYQSNSPILKCCGISPCTESVENTPRAFTGIQEMTAAVEAAKLDVSLDLDEALKLRNILEKSTTWNERVALIAPKRNKRHGRGARSKFTLKDLIDLIEESSSLPIKTDENVNRLQIQLNAVETWRADALKQLQNIVFGFHNLRSHVDDVYGEAEEYSIDRISETPETDDELMNDHAKDQKTDMMVKEDNLPMIESESIPDSDEDNSAAVRGSDSTLSVLRLIKELNDEAKGISVITTEGEIGELMDSVSKWCTKSFKYLNAPREVFDKRYFGAFDRFIVEGKDLHKISSDGCIHSNGTLTNDLSNRLNRAWGCVVNDQLKRLLILKAEREKFENWCKRASKILSDEKKLTAEKLIDLAKQSRNFPANRDLVSKIRGISVKVSKWTQRVRGILECKEKIAFNDARNLVETGEKLKVQSAELKRLRTEIRAARNWSSRVKECNLHQGSIHVNDVKQLIEEHDSLLIEMPDELDTLMQATVGYCICRRPYDGFMIGCDHCEEWYHGPCIGISESKADRFEKFICVRCSTKKILNSSSTAAAGIIRKWTCGKDLKKARQIEFQKLQRKDRKEKKDIEKFTKGIKQLEAQLSQLKRSDQMKKTSSSGMGFETMAPREVILGHDSLKRNIENQTEQSDDQSTNILFAENGESVNTVNDDNSQSSDQTTYVSNSMTSDGGLTTVELEKAKARPTEVSDISKCIRFETNAGSSSIALVKEAETLSKLEKLKAALKQSKARSDSVLTQSKKRSCMEAKEDGYSGVLESWCLKIRSELLLPSSEAQSERTRPKASGIMPLIFLEIISEAKDLGISDLPDVNKMIDCLKGICWSFSAMHILRRKPSISEFRHLITEASKFKLPDEKALKTIRFMANKASQLQSKVQKAICPKAGEKKSFNVTTLKGLESGIRDLPLLIPEEQMLRNAIEDDGARHCKCGGARDGNRMLQCINCEKKFHLACIDIEKTGSDGKENWICPCCSVTNVSVSNMEDKACEMKNADLLNETSPHAPDPAQLWPPFGLKESQSAVEAFGSDCLAIPYAPCADSHEGDTISVPGKICSIALSQQPILSTREGRKHEASKSEIAPSVSAAIEEVSLEAEPKQKPIELFEPSFPSNFTKEVASEVKPTSNTPHSSTEQAFTVQDDVDAISPTSQSIVPNEKKIIDDSVGSVDAVVVRATLSGANDTSFSTSCGSESKKQWTANSNRRKDEEDLAGVAPEQCPEVSS